MSELIKRITRVAGQDFDSAECRVKNPHITARESIELANYIAALQAERDALASKCLSLENFCAEVAAVFENMGDSSINSARLKRIDSVMNVDAKTVLTARDAEVAKEAFIAGIRLRSQGSCNDWHKAAEEYAAQLRAKAQQ